MAGAIGEDGGPGDPLPFAGAVYVFERDLGGSGNWGEAAIIHPDNAQPFDGFGRSVAIHGDSLVAGVIQWNLWIPGKAYAFERDLGGPGNWGEAAVLFAGGYQPKDGFGFAVATAGETLVVGAPSLHGGPGGLWLYTGAAYIYQKVDCCNYLPVIMR